MKKGLLILIIMVAFISKAQDQKAVPQISVSGEGKISVKPDLVVLNFGIENIGDDAIEVKKHNDQTVDKVLKYIKNFGIPVADFQTTNISLNRNYDYDKKKYFYQAVQSITINLNDISKYDHLILGLVDNGINNISNVEFKSSKIEEYKSEARKLALKDAKHKAEDYVSVLNQKVGKAILINDASQIYYPSPVYKSTKLTAIADFAAPKETLATGEIDVIANVSVTFILE
jgi:uncharacterized protein YggE